MAFFETSRNREQIIGSLADLYGVRRVEARL
jgi:hypothetical protein